MNDPAIVVCVDDDPALLAVLAGQLAPDNYDLRSYSLGSELLADRQTLEECDLILLDVMMPEMDGFLVTEKIRAEFLRFLPVILVTALGSTEHKTRGLDAGATDFISKPTIPAELRARVRAHLRSKQMHDENVQLGIMKDNLTRMIVHDLRNPLTAVSLALEMMGDPPDPDQLDEVSWDLTRRQVEYGVEMCEQMLDITKIEHGTLDVDCAAANIRQTASAAAAAVELQARERRIVIVVAAPDAEVLTDHKLVKRVILNLLANAIKFSPLESEIRLQVETADGEIRIAVSDRGPGIHQKYHQKIFELFGSAGGSSEARGAGLGLAFCQMAATALNGTIHVESSEGSGSCFIVEIPCCKSA